MAIGYMELVIEEEKFDQMETAIENFQYVQSISIKAKNENLLKIAESYFCFIGIFKCKYLGFKNAFPILISRYFECSQLNQNCALTQSIIETIRD